MIIEFFGLPGSGKSTLSQELQQHTNRFQIPIPQKKRWLVFLFACSHPLIFWFWIKELIVVSFSAPKTRKLFALKLSLLLDVFAKLQYCSQHKGKIFLLEEGLLQRMLSVYESLLTPSHIKHILKFIPTARLSVVLDRQGEPFHRYTHPENPRFLLGEEYLKTWKQTLEANFLLVRNVLEEEYRSTFTYTSEMNATDVYTFLSEHSFFYKILIFTQKINKNDDVLGFFHEWTKVFKDFFEHISIVCLEKGEYDFSSGVEVFSLGKESQPSRFLYLIKFFGFLLRSRGSYDAVLVHMNPIYVVLGAWLWKWQHIPIILWYNHPRGNLLSKTAFALSTKTLCTSEHSFFASKAKTSIMPAGIDTQVFSPEKNIEKPLKSLLFLGRISPIKKLDVLLEALTYLDTQGESFSLSVYGGALPQDTSYFESVQTRSEMLVQKGKVHFYGSVANAKTNDIYRKHDLFINLTPTGSFDKALLEAMACGTLVIACNKSFASFVPQEFLFEENNSVDLAQKIQCAWALSAEQKQRIAEQLRTSVQEHHELKLLASKLRDSFQLS